MKIGRWMLGWACVAVATGWGADAELGAAFHAARQAYDAGRFSEAAAIYEREIESGRITAETWHNLGNARYRLGDMGRAALAYHRAARLSPRDPDIRANLHQVRRVTLAAVDPDGRIEAAASWLTESEWAVIGWIGYAGFFLVAGAMAWFRNFRRVGRLWLAGFLVVSIPAAAGWGALRFAERRPHLVVIAPEGAEARFAPLPDAAVHYRLPPASVVRQLGESGTWRRISLGRNVGWIPANAVERVAP